MSVTPKITRTGTLLPYTTLFRSLACEEWVVRNRSRPCLQYQIGRCSAPCVELISSEDYAQSVRRAMLFLDGQSSELVADLERAMEQASAQLDFEQAAVHRDLIAELRVIQSRQYVDGTQEIGRAAWRESVCKYGSFTVGAVLLTQTLNQNK